MTFFSTLLYKKPDAYNRVGIVGVQLSAVYVIIPINIIHVYNNIRCDSIVFVRFQKKSCLFYEMEPKHGEYVNLYTTFEFLPNVADMYTIICLKNLFNRYVS